MRVVPRADGGSELLMEMEDRPHAIGARLMIPLIRGMIAKAIETDMDRVKAWCEGQAGEGEPEARAGGAWD
jgi:hypothetical protein